MSDPGATSLAAFFEKLAPRGVVSAYFFGSDAEGRSHRESDVDVAALLDRDVFAAPRERFEECLRLIGELGAALGRSDVDLVVLNDAPPELAARIVTKGVRICCALKERRTMLFAATSSFVPPT